MAHSFVTVMDLMRQLQVNMMQRKQMCGSQVAQLEVCDFIFSIMYHHFELNNLRTTVMESMRLDVFNVFYKNKIKKEKKIES